MNHRDIVESQSRRIYDNRNYVLHKLDTATFKALNQTPARRADDGTLYETAPAPVIAINGYCLDALDEIPQGCMVAFAGMAAQGYVVRGKDWADVLRCREISTKLIAESLAELDPE